MGHTTTDMTEAYVIEAFRSNEGACKKKNAGIVMLAIEKAKTMYVA
jgi:hypothetical protein